MFPLKCFQSGDISKRSLGYDPEVWRIIFLFGDLFSYVPIGTTSNPFAKVSLKYTRKWPKKTLGLKTLVLKKILKSESSARLDVNKTYVAPIYV